MENIKETILSPDGIIKTTPDTDNRYLLLLIYYCAVCHPELELQGAYLTKYLKNTVFSKHNLSSIHSDYSRAKLQGITGVKGKKIHFGNKENSVKKTGSIKEGAKEIKPI